MTRRKMIGIGRAIKIRNRWLAEQPVARVKLPPIRWTGARPPEKPSDAR